MKILTIGDPHFKISNVKETQDMCIHIYQLLETESIDLIVVMGDTLDRHEHIHVVPLTQSINFLIKLSTYAKTYLLIGNHDRPNNSDFMSNYHPFNGLRNINNLVIVDKGILENIQNMNFLFIPYVYPGRFREAINLIPQINLSEIKCIFAHQEFYGTKMGAVISVVGDKWGINEPFVISGHIHDYCRPQDNIVYVGTPLQHAFGDRDDKTVSIFDINEMILPSERRIDLGLLKRKICRIKCQDLITWQPPDNYLVKLIVEGTSSEIKAIMKLNHIKSLMKKGIKIVYNNIDEIHIGTNKQIDLESIKLPYAERLKKLLKSDELYWFNKLFN